ncbi:hypothetical protein [uncultured Clostridium sp.]|uniref:hypothetical protein n=1 Tax=uncultured Clostridium sp. TaxID=59620 RepID=UPI00263412DC|nr:hypothetical protein [uncultured Clostridium sp.]
MFKINDLKFNKIIDQDIYTVLIANKTVGTINIDVEFTIAADVVLSTDEVTSIERVFMAYIG